MNRHQSNGLVYYTFAGLEGCPGLIHAVTTRHGGVSQGKYASLNLTPGTGDDPEAVEENLRRVSSALGLQREHLVSPNQRHTANVRQAGRADRGQVLSECDALITDEPGVPLLLRYADCTPVLIYDPVRRCLALVHSGWRGTMQAVARAAVEALVAAYGSRPADMIAAVGPSIGPCCYRVGAEVVAAAQSVFDDAESLLPTDPLTGQRTFDLWAANRRWLAEAGVGRIEVAGLCTACRRDEFYSYRAEHGRTGHFGAVMALQENA